MSTALEKYTPSGKLGGMTFVFTLGAMVASALVAFIYERLMSWIPFIYLNFLIVLGFAALLMIAGTLVADVGRSRNPIVAGVLGVALGVVAWAASFYFAWRHGLSEASESYPEMSMEQLAEALPFWTYIDARVESGWTIKSANMNGLVVYILWAIEGICLVGAAAFGFYSRSQDAYCEEHQKWHDKQTGALRGVTAADLKPLLDSGDLSGVLSFPEPPEADEMNKISFERAICDGCHDRSFLTVTAHVFTKNSKGELDEKKEILATHLLLSSQLGDQFTARFLAPAAAFAPASVA